MSPEKELLRRISSHSGSVIPSHFIYEIQELLAQPETEQDLILEWYKKGYKQGFVDGQDVTDMILGVDDE